MIEFACDNDSAGEWKESLSNTMVKRMTAILERTPCVHTTAIKVRRRRIGDLVSIITGTN